MHRLVSAALAAGVASALLVVGAAPAAPPANKYVVTPLVSNVPGVAPTTDANLRNSWGLARSGGSPWWVADNGTDKTTVYNGSGQLQMIGGHAFQDVPGAPTGAVFSGITGQFQVDTTASPGTLGTSNFIFDAEDGTISAWRGGSTAARVTVPASPGASYKGLAISNGSSGPRLYAADFGTGNVDVFDGTWSRVNNPGQFTDPKLPKHYVPFGIQTIGSRVFVTYAIQGPNGDEIDKKGAGIVDVYDLDGNFLARVAAHGKLNAPWGLAQAPADWGTAVAGDLLVGNFGDGTIHAFREDEHGHWHHDHGSLRNADGKKLVIDGLWALEFGNNTTNNGSAHSLFFTAGPNDEADGLFGTIAPPPTG
jgi:uncharacterized protein (TIGR03118 family)